MQGEINLGNLPLVLHRSYRTIDVGALLRILPVHRGDTCLSAPLLFLDLRILTFQHECVEGRKFNAGEMACDQVQGVATGEEIEN